MTEPDRVMISLSRHLLVDGFDLVVDLEASRGSWLVDARDGDHYLDLFSFFASNALGMNHPRLVGDPEFRAQLTTAALHKPSNSDVYTPQLARFVETFERVLADPALDRYFFIEGGAAAVENALKVAFDWKSRHNETAGRDPALGTKVLHLRGAFHGRTGYAMSVTDTAPVKTARYPTFGWPCVDAPVVRFPLADHLAEVERAEQRALDQAREAFAASPYDIACCIVEPIQGEGGDRHLRGEFLAALHRLCEQHEALFVIDEIQTGVGLTGSRWCYEQLDLDPDVVVFGKKLHVGGLMAGRRVHEVPDNALMVSDRLNSTFGGNLTDMVRATRIMEVIEDDRLIPRAAQLGKLLAAQLDELAGAHPDLVSEVRGRGLLWAFDLPDPAVRAEVRRRLFTDEQVVMLGCGPRSLRFRPALTIDEDELIEGCRRLDRVLDRMGSAGQRLRCPPPPTLTGGPG